jgi:hypothetical protein
MTQALSSEDIDAIARRIADLADGSGTQRCVSLAEGALGADLRVNYSLGMVLGVDEFQQEQHYFLQKEYLHNRALHGYGTVYGLQVALSRPAGAPNDVQISVAPGMAVDQWGRVVIVREAQCARLGAWLEKHPAPDVGPSGEQRVYITLRYDECLALPQPIAGQPCSGSEAQMAPSRIRDGFQIELSWSEPAMPAYRAGRRFARLMADVQVEPGLPPSASDEDLIVAVIRELNGDGESIFDQGGPGVAALPLSPPRDTLFLPAEGLREALDRIFAVWATEVRFALPPSLTDPAGASGGNPDSASVLLAAIGFLPEPPFIESDRLDEAADNTIRPVLLHTQLIQQLLLLGGRALPASFADLRAYGTRVLHAWVHYPAPLTIKPEALRVLRDGREVAVGAVRRLSASANLFEIVLEPDGRVGPGPLEPFPDRPGTIEPFPDRPGGLRPLPAERVIDDRIGDLRGADELLRERALPAPGARVELIFRLDRIGWPGDDAFAPERRIGAGNLGYDRRTDTITTRLIVEPSQEEFAQIQARGGGSLHLWLNTPDELAVPDARAFTLSSEGLGLQVTDVRRIDGARNHFVLTAARSRDEEAGRREGLLDPGAQVELQVNLAELALADGAPLLPRLDQGCFAYLGRDGDTVTLRAIAAVLPAVRELVTVRAEPPGEGRPALSLWFHPNTEGLVSLPTEREAALEIFSLERERELRFSLRPVDPVTRNGRTYATVWRAELQDEAPLADGERLVLTFLTARVLTAPAGETLAALIEQQHLAFVGFADDRVLVHTRVSLPAAGGDGISAEEVRRIVREALLRRPSMPFVTITPERLRETPNGLVRPFELWFHLDLDPSAFDALVLYRFQEAFVGAFALKVLAETGVPGNRGARLRIPDPANPPQLVDMQLVGEPELVAYNRFRVLINHEQLKEFGNPPLRFIFPVGDLELISGGARFRLGEYISQEEGIPIGFSGYNGRETIVAYVRLAEEEGR